MHPRTRGLATNRAPPHVRVGVSEPAPSDNRYELQKELSEGSTGSGEWMGQEGGVVAHASAGRLGTAPATTCPKTAKLAASEPMTIGARGALLEHSRDGTVLIGGDGRILYASPSLANVLGYATEELVDKDIFSLIHPEDVQHTAML